MPESANEVDYTFLAVRQSLTYTVQGGTTTSTTYLPAAIALKLSYQNRYC